MYDLFTPCMSHVLFSDVEVIHVGISFVQKFSLPQDEFRVFRDEQLKVYLILVQYIIILKRRDFVTVEAEVYLNEKLASFCKNCVFKATYTSASLTVETIYHNLISLIKL